MKRLLAFFAAICSFAGIAAPYAVGDAVSDLDDCVWIQRDPVPLAGKREKPVVLFFWSISYSGNQDVDKMISLAGKFGDSARIVAVGCDEEAKIRAFFRLKEMDFPVVSDTVLANLNRYVRNHEKVPFCTIIDRDGRLAWRGPAARVERPLKEIVENRYDLENAVRIDRFTLDLADAMQKKDYSRALELSEKERIHSPENIELLVLVAGLYENHLQKPEQAKKIIEDTLQKYSGNAALHELRLKYLHTHNFTSEILPAVDFAIEKFSGDLHILERLIRCEMEQPPKTLAPEALVHLGRAAAAVQCPEKRDHALAMLLYARILVFCGAIEPAVGIARNAREFFEDERDIGRADDLIRLYSEMLRVSRSFSEKK